MYSKTLTLFALVTALFFTQIQSGGKKMMPKTEETKSYDRLIKVLQEKGADTKEVTRIMEEITPERDGVTSSTRTGHDRYTIYKLLRRMISNGNQSIKQALKRELEIKKLTGDNRYKSAVRLLISSLIWKGKTVEQAWDFFQTIDSSKQKTEAEKELSCKLISSLIWRGAPVDQAIEIEQTLATDQEKETLAHKLAIEPSFEKALLSMRK